MLTTALWAIGGAAGSKFLTQAVLGAKNEGWLGYGANLASAFLLGQGVSMFMKNKQAGNAVILGGVIQTVLRVLVDKTPLGERLSKLGMGDYQLQGFLTPQRLQNGLRSAAIEYPAQLGAAFPAPAVAGAGGMRGLGRRSLM